MAKILIAEDETHISKLIEFKLKKDGHHVVVAHDGDEATQLIDSDDWTLFILDIMMPKKKWLGGSCRN